MPENQPLAVVAGVVRRNGRVMICQRRPEVHNGLKWEFPGGKLEKGESPEQALARELREELGIEALVGGILGTVRYRYPEKEVLVMFFDCRILRGEPKTLDCNAIEWVTPRQLKGYDFAGADRVFVTEKLKL